jgi:hypothetical protein
MRAGRPWRQVGELVHHPLRPEGQQGLPQRFGVEHIEHLRLGPGRAQGSGAFGATADRQHR